MIRLTVLLITLLMTNSTNAQAPTPTNKHFWYSLETTATPEIIWSIWTEVDQWHHWDTGLKAASMTTPFALAAKGQIISLEGRKSKFKVVDFIPGESYTFKTNLPLGGLYVKRYLSTRNGKTVFTHEVWFQGLTKGIFAKAFGGKFRKLLPEVLENIKKIAEKK